MEQLANFTATTTLFMPGNLDSSSTTITVGSKFNFPTSYPFRIRIGNELLKVLASPNSTDYLVIRGDGGTTPATHLNGVTVLVVLTKESLDNLVSIQDDDSEIGNRRILNFTSGILAVDDGSNERANVSIPRYYIFLTNSVVGPTTEEIVPTQLPGLSVSFTLLTAKNIKISVDIRLLKQSGQTRLTILDGTTKIAPVLANTDFKGWYSRTVSEFNGQIANFFTIVNLAAGSHTINIFHESSNSTTQVTWYDRSLVCEVL